MRAANLAGRTHISNLDGLRALAVFLVLLHHFGPYSTPLLWRIRPVGWVGVDMFFVLSGFLITGILLRTRRRADYYRAFYVRRSLRIFPLYYCVLTGILLSMYWWDHGEPLRALLTKWGNPIWYWLYAGNIKSALIGSGPPSASLIPLWSLHVEEQFYLLFPFVVRHLRIRTLLRTLVWIIILSPLLRFALWELNPTNVHLQYDLLPSRLDGLAMGAFIAVRIRFPWKIPERRLVIATLAALSLAYGSYVLLGHNDWQQPFSRIVSYSAFSAAFACILLYVVRFQESRALRWLHAAPLRFIGRISYGLYLFQYPAAAMLGALLATTPLWHSEMGRLVTIATVTTLLATLSWYALERPMLALKDRFAPPDGERGSRIQATAALPGGQPAEPVAE